MTQTYVAKLVDSVKINELKVVVEKYKIALCMLGGQTPTKKENICRSCYSNARMQSSTLAFFYY